MLPVGSLKILLALTLRDEAIVDQVSDGLRLTLDRIGALLCRDAVLREVAEDVEPVASTDSVVDGSNEVGVIHSIVSQRREQKPSAELFPR